MKKIFLLTTFSLVLNIIHSQTDSIKQVTLDEITVNDIRQRETITRLENVKGTYIFSGKKSEVINLENLDANISEKTGRQVFAKIPGVFVYDMDGSGNQINISTRGLDAHRGWEFNIRKDGVITNSDMYGYPASHYSMPLESIERIELVRGTGSLQYGAQFGGMLNYVTKQPNENKKISFEAINTVGSFGLLSTYNSVGGKIGKIKYFAYFNKRVSDGYRDNASSDANAAQITLEYSPIENLTIKAEWAKSAYVYRLPGALTDAMFNANPKQSTRKRNYFNPDINVPSISVDWKINNDAQLLLTTSAVLGARNSVMFDKTADINDTIVTSTNQYNNRQVDIDHFNSYYSELRFLQKYKLNNQISALAIGLQYVNGDLHRQQLGVGTRGSDFDLSLVTSGFGRDLHYKTQNFAFFIENNFKISDKFSVNAGSRLEYGQTNMTGNINYLSETELPNTVIHHFPLFGLSGEYKINAEQKLYGGWSQSYRPVILKDIIPQSSYDRSDKNLKDAYGYNLEAGYRGGWHFLKWDVSYFRMQCDNRLGKLSMVDSTGHFYIFSTNIGSSVTNGAEFFVEGNFSLNEKVRLTVFTSTSLMDARYQNAAVKSGNMNVDISGNKVESVPSWITRNGITLKLKKVSFSTLYSFVGETFANPLNTITPTANGSVGLVPSYSLIDLNATFRATAKITFKLNCNNVTDAHYFTKRPLFYPGPGIWSSDGRSVNVSIGIKI